MSLRDEVLERIHDRLTGNPPQNPPAVSFTQRPMSTSGEFAVCTECGAALFPSDTSMHSQWHVDQVSASLRPLVGDGSQTVAMTGDLMELTDPPAQTPLPADLGPEEAPV